MVLGAGVGSRLASLRLEVPKILVPIAGRPLLAWQLDYLWGEGIARVVVNAHHRAEAIELFAEQYTGPLSLTVIREPELLGTAGGVRNALPALAEDPFFVLYGDVVTDHPLAPLAQAHLDREAEATIAVYRDEVIEGKGTVEVDEHGWVRSFREKDPAVIPPGLINAGVYLVSTALLRDVERGQPADFGRDVFPAALARAARILSYDLGGSVIDMGTPEGLAAAHTAMSRRT